MASLCRWSLSAIFGALTLAAAAAFAAPGDDIKALLEQGKAAEAYSEGRKYPEQLGNPAFDFYFGIAAIAAGHAGEGVLALERYLLNFPDNLSARVELARGYFALGEDGRAREEFQGVLATKPPANVAATVQRYLDAIRLRESRYTPTGGLYVELGIGHDSNVNAGPASANLFTPFTGPIVLAPGSQKQSDTFASIGAGGYYSHPVRPGVALFVNGQGERKFNFRDENEQFELGNYNLAGGVSLLREKNLYRLALNYGVITVGSSTYRTALGGAVEWAHQLDERQSFSLGAQAARLDYPDPNAPRDADLLGLSVGYKRAFSYSWQPVITLGASASSQHSRTGRPDLTPRTWGANAALNFTPAAKWGVAVGYNYLESDYRGPDLFGAGEARHDRYQAVDAALTYLYSRNISFRAEALWSKNRSNLEVYEFPRDIYALKVRYEFK